MVPVLMTRTDWHFLAQHDPRTRFGDENVQSFARSSEPDRGATALNLVYQAAEVFSEIEVRAQEAEARAQSLYATATEKLQFAEDLVESAQRSRREIIADADRRLKEASRALKQAELQITAAEDKAIAADLRAQVAEEKARKAIEAPLASSKYSQPPAWRYPPERWKRGTVNGRIHVSATGPPSATVPTPDTVRPPPRSRGTQAQPVRI